MLQSDLSVCIREICGSRPSSLRALRLCGE